MRALVLAGAALLLVSGCGNDKYLVRLDLDERLIEECTKELPVLANGSDQAAIEWTASMLTLYEKCANKQKAIVEAIAKYNEKVVKESKVDLGGNK